LRATCRGCTDLPIVFWDERLSTVAASARSSRRIRRAASRRVIDHVAAGFILQGMLDRLGHLEERDDG
jgi:putative Holliday junction resolvase